MRHADHMEDRRKLLGEHLREVRYAAGYRGRPAFAEAAGIAERSVSAVELGAGGRKSRSAMARVLGIEPAAVEDYVTGRTDELPQPAEPPRASRTARDPIAKVVAASEAELDEIVRLVAKWRGPSEGERFRAWADGVRARDTAEQDSVTTRPREREPR
jgi:transcriptional regulator with XRE-family HTH domain